MAMSNLFRSLVWRVVLLLVAVNSCSAALASWWTDRGPQIIRQNATTGQIMYSMCNSNYTPIFPTDPPLTFSLSYPPLNGTALSGVGWFTKGTTWASIFYQSQSGDLINGIYVCDWPTGKFVPKGPVVISNAENAVVPNAATGLASVLLGETDGYRVFYHDQNMTIHQLSYAPDVNDDHWAYAGKVAPDRASGKGIAATFGKKPNVTLVFPKDAGNMEVSRFNTDKLWHQTSFPYALSGNWTQAVNSTNLTSLNIDFNIQPNFTLPAWNGTPRALAAVTDSVLTRSVFYLGTDRRLYQVSSINFVWTLRANRSADLWPLADDPAADFAAAYHVPTSLVRLYYPVAGALTELKQTADGEWQPALALATSNATGAIVAAPPPPPPADDNAAPPGLSAAAKAGLAVGVTLAVLAVAGGLAAVCVLRRRRRRGERAAEAAARAERDRELEARRAAGLQELEHQRYHDVASPGYPSPYGSPSPPYEGQVYVAGEAKTGAACETQELEGKARAVYEMAEEGPRHELQ